MLWPVNLIIKGQASTSMTITFNEFFNSAQLEKYKSEKSALVSELSELRAAHTDLEQRANAESEKYAEMKKKLSYCEVKAAEYRFLHHFH